MTISLLRQALGIAQRDLRECYLGEGIIAGTHHFTDYWARDAFFAALGSLEIGDKDIVEKLVGLFFSHQRSDGLIPYRILRGPVTIGKYLGKPKLYSAPRPTYKLRGIGQEVLDGTTLTVLMAALLHQDEYMNHIRSALDFLESKERHGLLWDGPMAEWNDTALKYGNLLYSNVIYWYMYDRLAAWTKDDTWSAKRDRIARSMRNRLWNGSFFADWHDYKRQDYFYPFGNCLAIAWGMTAPGESASILSECEKHIVSFTLETNSPPYPWWRIDPLQQAVGMGSYQNHSTLWWQPVVAYITALNKTNRHGEAERFRNICAKKIAADGKVYECFQRNGKPLRKRIYTSEGPFAWSSGMLVWALSQ